MRWVRRLFIGDQILMKPAFEVELGQIDVDPFACVVDDGVIQSASELLDNLGLGTGFGAEVVALSCGDGERI